MGAELDLAVILFFLFFFFFGNSWCLFWGQQEIPWCAFSHLFIHWLLWEFVLAFGLHLKGVYGVNGMPDKNGVYGLVSLF